MTVWLAIAATAAGCYLFKVLGVTAPPGLVERPRVRQFAVFAPIALLAGLTALQTFGAGHGLTVDARAGGLAAAAIAVALRAPFLVVIVVAVAATAALRALV